MRLVKGKAVIFCLLFTFITAPSKGGIFFPLSKLKPKEENTTKKVLTSNETPKEILIDTGNFTLTGIAGGKRKFAIINNQVVGVSDKIGNCYVKDILPLKKVVILNCNGYEVELFLNKRLVGKEK